MLHDQYLITDANRMVKQDNPIRSAITSLMNAMVVMRADISYAVTSVARFTANPGLSHWRVLVRIFYLKRTSAMSSGHSDITPWPLFGCGRSYYRPPPKDAPAFVSLFRSCCFWLTRFWKPCLSTFEKS